MSPNIKCPQHVLKIIVYAVLIQTIHSYRKSVLEEQFSWTRISYLWNSRSNPSYSYEFRTKRAAYRGGGGSVGGGAIVFPQEASTQNGVMKDYRYENNIPMGANIWRDKLFVTVPRRRLGVPSSLNYVHVNSSRRQDLALIPYPDWETNRLDGQAKERIVSVYRVAVDPCDRLWFVDTGIIETPGDIQQVQPTRLVIMDLRTDRILRTHNIPAEYLRQASNLASVTVDVDFRSCRTAYAYLPDLGGYSLLVYSLELDRSWRVAHNYFHLEPLNGEFLVGGFRFQWNDGIFSVAVSATDDYGHRMVYFHAMAATSLYAVSTRVLRNETAATRAYHGDDFKRVGDKGRGMQTSSSVIHPGSGVLFMGMPNQNGVYCWRLGTPLDRMVLVHSDSAKMIYPSDLKVAGDQLVVLTNNMPIFLYGRLNYNQVNFRVWSGNVYDMIRGTTCDY